MSSPLVLQPFTPETAPSSTVLTATPTRNQTILSIEFQLAGAIHQFEVPPPTQPFRADNLWTTTCFEFFFGVPQNSHYWEVNLSPSGQWNVYEFSGYREQMKEAIAVSALPFTMKHTDKALSLSVELDLAPLNLAKQDLEVGITAVLKTRAGDVSYWAIAHTGSTADFHRRDSFIIPLSPY